MTPQKQQFTHEPKNGQYGDCKRAVIASLLDLPIEDVPHFLRDAKGDPDLYWSGLQAFLRGRGLSFLTVRSRGGHFFFGDDQPLYHEISGPSPRAAGRFHSVVGCDGEIVFDPHPDGTGLAGDPMEWDFGYLVKVCDSNIVTNDDEGLIQHSDLIEGVDKTLYATEQDVEAWEKSKRDAVLEEAAVDCDESAHYYLQYANERKGEDREKLLAMHQAAEDQAVNIRALKDTKP